MLCSPGWPQTCNIDKDDLELLLPLPPSVYYHSWLMKYILDILCRHLKGGPRNWASSLLMRFNFYRHLEDPSTGASTISPGNW